MIAALNKVESMVLVITAEAMASPIIRKAWCYARQKGICVYPVKGVPDEELDWRNLPRWIRTSHFYDLGRERPRFVDDLNTRCRVPRIPFMVDDLPNNFVQRPYVFTALIDQLLDTRSEKPLAITTSLCGASGCGKTTLAMALCHDERLQDAYGDGVLWVTLGEAPGDLTDKVNRLIEALNGKRAGCADLESAANYLGMLLAERDLLIVIDDARDYGQLKPFLRGGPRCSRLITTRDRAILPKAVKRNILDAMQESEALKLLRYKLPASEDDELHRISGRLGHWPLLLKIVNASLFARVAGLGQILSDAVSDVGQKLGAKGLMAFDAGNHAGRKKAVEDTLQVSLELLGQEDRRRFDELAIFPETTGIPLEILKKLWMHAGLGDQGVEDLCERFYSLGLLRLFDVATRTIKLDAAIQSHLRNKNETQRPMMHTRFLEAYGIDQWADLPPDEPYLWRHLADHLADSGDRRRLKHLLLDYGWLKGKLAISGVNALISDFDHLPHEETLSLVKQALRLSANQLARDFDQLAPHLIGRLNDRKDPEIVKLLRKAAASQEGPWFAPMTRSLTAPGGPLLRTLEGHRDDIRAVAISPDGRRALSGCYDKRLKLWDLFTGKTIHTLEGHRHHVNAVAISPDGRQALSGSSDKTLKLWNLATGKLTHTLEGHGDWVCAVAISPDGRHALSGAYDKTLKLWDLAAGKAIRTLEGHGDWVCAVAISPDGRHALSGSDDKTLRLWDLATGKAIHTLEGHRFWVRAVAISPDGRHALSGSDDKTLRLWDLASGRTIHTLEGHRAGVRAVAISPDGQRALSGASDTTLKLWDLATGKAIHTFEGHRAGIRAVAITPDGRCALSGSSDATLKLWDLVIDKAIYTLEGHGDEVSVVAVSADGRRALTGSDDTTLKLWDLATGKAIHALEGHRASVSAAAISADGRHALSASIDTTLKLWDLATGQVIHSLEGHRFWVCAVAISPDGQRALSGSDDKNLILWDLATGQAIRTFEGHSFWIRTVAISPDGRRALSGSDDATLRLWDLATGQAIHTLDSHGKGVSAAVISPDGRRALSASDDATLRLWDLATGQAIHTLEGHRKGVRAVAVSPDGGRALSGSDDTTLKLWDLATGQAIHTLEGHRKGVRAVAFSPDGGRALSGSDDTTVKLWDLATGRVLASFMGESEMTNLAVSPCGAIVLAGEADGHLHFLTIKGV